MQRAVERGHADFGRAIPCPSCELGADRLWGLAGVPARQREHCTFDSFDLRQNPDMAPALDAARAWADGSGPPFLLLMGPRGVGKTHLAVAAVAGMIARRVRVLYEFAPRYLDDLRSTQRNDAELTLNAVRWRAETEQAFVLDDLGAGKATDWAEAEIGKVVDARWTRELPTLVTSNVAPDEIEGRTLSRLVDRRLSRVVACSGRDVRMVGL